MKEEETIQFQSPSFGPLSFVGVMEKIKDFLAKEPEFSYEIIIGTDSCSQRNLVEYVTALVVHRIGKGGIYFWQKATQNKIFSLKQRIYEEAFFSLGLAQRLVGEFKLDGFSAYNLEIHVDIGPNGKTRDLISEIVGMIRGNGFKVKTKPDAYGASKVADRHT